MFNKNNKSDINLDEFNIWSSTSLFHYVIHNYKQFLLLLLAIMIIVVIDYINYYNSLIYGVMQVIPGVPNNTTTNTNNNINANIKSKKNKTQTKNKN